MKWKTFVRTALLASIGMGNQFSTQGGSYTFVSIADTDSGSILEIPDWATPTINNHGAVAFLARLDTGEPVIYRSDGETLTVIADGTVMDADSWHLRYGRPSINDSGLVAFWTKFPLGGSAILAGDGEAFITIADGSLVDDLAWERNFTRPVINNNGTVAFWATPTSGTPGLFTGNGGALATVVDETMLQISSTDRYIGINDGETVVFDARKPSASYSSIYAGTGGTPSEIRAGMEGSPVSWPAIDDAGNVVFSIGNIENYGIMLSSSSGFSMIVPTNGLFRIITNKGLNNSGTVAFRAQYNGAGGTGLFIGRNGVAESVIEGGDALFGSTVSGNSFLQGGFRGDGGINDKGEIVFRYALVNGISGIAKAILLTGYQAWAALHGLAPGDGTEDTDLDGQDDRSEYEGGTDPNDPNDSFKLEIRTTPSGREISWLARLAMGTGYEDLTREYTLERSPNVDQGPWTDVPGHTNVPGNDTLHTYAIPATNDLPVFYRGRVSLIGP